MYDVFISYTASDEAFARFVHKHLIDENISSFLAPISIPSGESWSKNTLDALGTSKWVLFLASKAACASPFVLQEVGIAIGSGKKLIPVVWDMPPDQLPGWACEYHALNLAGKSPDAIRSDVLSIARNVKAEQLQGLMIAGLLIAGLMICCRG